MLPYAQRIDTEPFGCEVSLTNQLLGEQAAYMGEYLQREVTLLPSGNLVQNLGNVDTVPASELLIDPSVNAVVLSRRRAFGAGGLRSGGICAFTEKGLGNGSVIWVNLRPRGITNDFDLGVVEAKLAHELWHSVLGPDHCKTDTCLLSPDSTTEDMYNRAQLPSKGLCYDHRVAIDAIARNPHYFERLRATQ